MPKNNAKTETRTQARSGSHDENSAREQHTTVKLRGGGPMVTLRNTRGDIVIR